MVNPNLVRQPVKGRRKASRDYYRIRHQLRLLLNHKIELQNGVRLEASLESNRQIIYWNRQIQIIISRYKGRRVIRYRENLKPYLDLIKQFDTDRDAVFGTFKIARWERSVWRKPTSILEIYYRTFERPTRAPDAVMPSLSLNNPVASFMPAGYTQLVRWDNSITGSFTDE